MKARPRLKLRANVGLAAAALGLGFNVTVTAAPLVSVDFESIVGYTLVADGGGTATRSTDQANSATHSAKLTLPNTVNDFAKVVVDVAPATVTLGQAIGTFKTYIPSGQTAGSSYAPYMYFLVDSNKNGIADFTGSSGGDSFVIAFFTPTIALDTWMQSGLDQSNIVHVVGDRSGLGATDFSSSNGGGLLSALDATSTGSGLWGNLDILQIRVGAGSTGGDIGPYTAYVDDINVSSSAVPEPATLALVGLALAGLGYSRRKQA